MATPPYVGRFAPSPSGMLHMGSLACAVASFLEAKINNGRWLLRIEDIDPLREQPGASLAIIKCLENHGLHWDGSITYQSEHSERYLEQLAWLDTKQLTYHCTCTRKRLATLDNRYDGHCRSQRAKPQQPASIRIDLDKTAQLVNTPLLIKVDDVIQTSITENLSASGDFVIHRKDGLFAYQLAVVVDDIDQGITHIVRGYDLFDCTAKQMLLTKLFNGETIRYSHIPILINDTGLKLSKQNHAPAIDDSHAVTNLISVLELLKQNPPAELLDGSTEDVLAWGQRNWNTNVLKDTCHLRI